LKSLEHNKLILIGASTGGPAQIEKIIASLDTNFDATMIIAQHMGEDFIPSFVKRLGEKSLFPISLAEDGMVMQNRNIYITSHNTELVRNNQTLSFRITLLPKSFYNPDITSLFKSTAKLLYGMPTLALILTGIGDDGVDGMIELYNAGASCIAESQESAIVYGMPARALEKIPTIEVASLEQIIQKIKEF
jgi:two-component system chemotaxis response regulator CheB